MPSLPFQIFLKLDGIEGECAVKGHEKETVVLSYEQAIDHSAATPAGGGASKPVFSGVRFRKPPDKGSALLLLACASGSHIKDARFAFRRAAATADFYKVTLHDVLVTRIVQRAGTGVQYPLSFDALTAGNESEGLLDEATLSFGKILWEYQPTGPDGAPAGPPVKGGWDLQLQKKVGS
jgi:type VI secretion system secreted protein Hcp